MIPDPESPSLRRLPQEKRRRRRGRPPLFCALTYRERNVIERLVGWLNPKLQRSRSCPSLEYRRLATRFEKLASSLLAMVKLAFIRRYFRALA